MRFLFEERHRYAAVLLQKCKMIIIIAQLSFKRLFIKLHLLKDDLKVLNDLIEKGKYV